MPVMDGYEFLKIVTEDEKYKSIPVIIETGEVSEEENILQLGASDFITKPYSPTVIISRIKALIRLSESVGALQESRLDPATGLCNRSYFGYMYKKIMDTLSDQEFDIILSRIKDVERITGVYGEEGFSKQLAFIGTTLSSFEGTNVYFCRVSATMFVVLKPHDKDGTLGMIHSIKEKLNTNAPVENVKYEVIYELCVDHELTFSVVINRLLSGLKTIEDSYEDEILEFDASMLEEDSKKLFITQSMEESLKNGDFKVFYQPKHETSSKELKGFEALVRWNHPVAGNIPPNEFISVMENNGFITKLDIYIFETVLKDMVKLKELGLKPLPVSINLSRRDLGTLNLEENFFNLIKKYDIDKSLIHLEITESLCGTHKDVIESAKKIKNAGIPIEIDDFGSGYSSLGIIDSIPMDYLKLDITFARNIESKKVVVKTIIDLAHALGAKTVAEGVESEEQYQIYKDFGCDLIQGWYFSKAICFDEYVEYLRKFGK